MLAEGENNAVGWERLNILCHAVPLDLSPHNAHTITAVHPKRSWPNSILHVVAANDSGEMDDT
jgi:hypothetical protein